jgi:hypothetical protein
LRNRVASRARRVDAECVRLCKAHAAHCTIAAAHSTITRSCDGNVWKHDTLQMQSLPDIGAKLLKVRTTDARTIGCRFVGTIVWAVQSHMGARP